MRTREEARKARFSLINPVCGFLVEELGELQGSVTRSMVEQEGNAVREDLPQQPASQVPKVLGPHSLFMQ
jgi:hypothetical protein